MITSAYFIAFKAAAIINVANASGTTIIVDTVIIIGN
jgi:hypothetical protein